MRLATIRTNGATAAGRLDGDVINVLPFDDLGELLASGPDWRRRAETMNAVGAIPVAEADFAPLITRPEKVICVGVNYRDHVAEVGLDVPEYPTLFAKFGRSLIGANDDITLPPNSDAVDWEVELGVVIGATVRHADEAAARAAIGGYTIVNDVSMRDWQLRTSQYLQGKTFEATTPVGPFLATPDEVGDARRLRVSCSVNGEIMQDSDTGQMLFSVAEIVSYISQFITLVPGDLIATGTPGGVGGARRPPVYLAAGHELRSRIDGLGEQINRCRPDENRPAATRSHQSVTTP